MSIVTVNEIAMVKTRREGLKVTAREISEVVAAHEYPPLLLLNEAAALARLKPNTLKRKASEGHYADSVLRGKPLRFMTNQFLKGLCDPKGMS